MHFSLIQYHFCLFAENDDIVFANIVDTYDNLTLKVLYGFSWAVRYCSNFDFIVKLDTDVFFNPFALIDYFHRENLLVNHDKDFIGKHFHCLNTVIFCVNVYSD